MTPRPRLPRLPRFAAAARGHGMTAAAILGVRHLARDLVLSNTRTVWTPARLDVALTASLSSRTRTGRTV